MNMFTGAVDNGPFKGAFLAASAILHSPQGLQRKLRHYSSNQTHHQSRGLSTNWGSLCYSFGLFANTSSDVVILHQIQNRGQKLHHQLESGVILEKSDFFGRVTGHHGYWQHCLLSLGSWFLFFGDPGRSHDTDHESKIAMASFGYSSSKSKSKGRFWTNVLIGLNVLMYFAQEASHGRLLILGAKINNMIDRGQLWRFLTPAFLHANLAHLLTNCYSLNSIGPVVEAQGGPKRFLAIYIGSAISGFFVSYSFTRAPAVGASGAVFGLVGALGVFFLRHKHLLNGAQESLAQLARVTAINLVLGLATSNIDNWGHLGGLIGGAAISWILGPAFAYMRIPGEKKMVLVDRPPISYLLPDARRRLS